MKASDLNPLSLLRKKYPKKEVKMEEKEVSQEARILQALEKLQDLPERMNKLEESQANLTQSSAESSDSSKELIEQLQNQVAQYEQEQVLLKHQGAEEFVQAFEANEIEDSELGRRIFSAIRKAGCDIEPHKEPAQVSNEQEEMEEEPDVVAGKKEGYQYLPVFNISIKE